MLKKFLWLIALFSILFASGCTTQTPQDTTNGEVEVPPQETVSPEIEEDLIEDPPQEDVEPKPVEDPALEPELEEPAPPPEPKPTPKAINETNFPLTLPDGFRISIFNPFPLGPVRFMAFSPDGILFATIPSETGLYSQNRSGGKVIALPDLDQDGKADEVKTVLTGFNNLPHGIAFQNGYLYIAEENMVTRYKYQNNGNLGPGEEIIGDLPSAEHVSRTIQFDDTGKIFVSVGSQCNVCVPQNDRTAAILVYDADGTNGGIFASGLRNAVGFVFHPQTGEIWATENARDLLGDDLPPEEINIVKEGEHYGWPYCYGKKIVDPQHNNTSFCTTTKASLFDFQAHSAPLGLRFIESNQFPQEWQGDLLVAYHGSWNRSVPTGYKVARFGVEGNNIVGVEDFITGWLQNGEASGRPVDLIFDSFGALYISDDKAGVIYRVTKIQEQSKEILTSLSLTSPAFENNASIPQRFTCDGPQTSLPLEIRGVPENASSLVLIMDDPDAIDVVNYVWDHWIVFNIDPNTFSIPEGREPSGTKGVGSSGIIGYEGPCPPQPRTHSYSIRLYALDKTLDLPEGSTKSDVQAAMQGNILAQTELIGKYKRV